MPRLVLSQSDRLLLHLHELEPSNEEFEVPLGASQEGMAQRLHTQVHNASRALSSLQMDGLVYDRLVHVRGVQKRRKGYFLTAKGRGAAEALIRDLMIRPVMVEDGRALREVSFSELLDVIKGWGKTPSIFDLAEMVRSSEILNLGTLRAISAKKEAIVSTRSQGRPRIESFFGRDSEKAELTALLHDPIKRVVMITGLAGIGKSTLASWAFETNLGKATQMWHTLHDWEGESSLLDDLCELLSSAGAAELAISSKGGHQFADMYAPLLRDLAAVRPVLFLDDLHKVSEAVLPLIIMLLDAVRSSEGSKLVLISRTVPAFYPIGRPDCVRIELSGLDETAARDLARSMRIADPDTAVRESHGHPLLLHLMAASGVAKAAGDTKAFLEQEICASLAEEERNALETISIYRHPIPAEALGDRQTAILPSLRAKGLVMEDEGGLWTHNLLSSYFLSRLGSERGRELHSKAARYCSGRQDMDWEMEALYHAVEACDQALAADLINRNGEHLALSFPKEVEAILLRASTWEGGEAVEAEILYPLALAQEELGHDTQALTTYDRLLELLERSGDERLAPTIERKARLQAENRKWTEAFQSHQRALHLYQASEDRLGEAREWLSLGSAHRRKGEVTRAREAFQESRELAQEMGDLAAEAAALNDLAMTEWDEGGLRRAEELLEQAVAKAHQAGDSSGEGLALENLSLLLRGQARDEEALKRLEESESAFLRGGEDEDRKRVIALRAAILGDTGREGEGVALLRSVILEDASKRLIKRLRHGRGPNKGDIHLQVALVRLLKESGLSKEAEVEATRLEDMAIAMNDPGLLAKARIEKAAVLEENHQFDSANEVLERARLDLSRQGDAEGLAVVLMRTAALAKRRGDGVVAVNTLREALRQAKLSASRLAEASVLEELGCSLEGEERRAALHKAIEIYSQMRHRADVERVRSIIG